LKKILWLLEADKYSASENHDLESLNRDFKISSSSDCPEVESLPAEEETITF